MNKVRFYFQTVALVAIALPLAFTACGNDDYYDMPSDVVWRGAESAEGTIVTTPYDERIEVPARKEGNTFAAHTVQYDGHESFEFLLYPVEVRLDLSELRRQVEFVYLVNL